MQIFRIIIWMLAAAIVVGMIIMNLQYADFNFWPLAGGKYLHVHTGMGIIVLIAFLAGLLPMWLLSRASKWRANRRIATLQNTVAASSVVAPVPVATSSQLEAAAPSPPAQEPTI